MTPPTQVHIVSWTRSVLAKGLGQVFSVFLGVVLALALNPFGPTLESLLSRWAYVEPTCDDPRDLKRLNVPETASIGVSSQKSESKWPILGMFDGRPGSGWVPATESIREAQSVASKERWPPTPKLRVGMMDAKEDLTATNSGNVEVVQYPRIRVGFVEPQQVRLLCIINGNGASSVSYMRADRVRTAKLTLRSAEGDDERTVPLKTVAEYEVQNRQRLWAKSQLSGANEIDEFDVEIVDRYSGEGTKDPALNDKYMPPTRIVMISELEVYVE